MIDPVKMPRDISLLADGTIDTRVDVSNKRISLYWHDAAGWNMQEMFYPVNHSHTGIIPWNWCIVLLGQLARLQVDYDDADSTVKPLIPGWYRQPVEGGFDYFLCLVTTDANNSPVMLETHRVFGPTIDEAELTDDDRVHRLLFTILFSMPLSRVGATDQANRYSFAAGIGAKPEYKVGWEGQSRADTSTMRLHMSSYGDDPNYVTVTLKEDDGYGTPMDLEDNEFLLGILNTFFQAFSHKEELVYGPADMTPNYAFTSSGYQRYSFVANPADGSVRMYRGSTSTWGMVRSQSPDCNALVATVLAVGEATQLAYEYVSRVIASDQAIEAIGAFLTALPTSEDMVSIVSAAAESLQIPQLKTDLVSALNPSTIGTPLLVSVLSLYRKKTGKTNYDKLVDYLRQVRVLDAVPASSGAVVFDMNPSVLQQAVAALNEAGDPKKEAHNG